MTDNGLLTLWPTMLQALESWFAPFFLRWPPWGFVQASTKGNHKWLPLGVRASCESHCWARPPLSPELFYIRPQPRVSLWGPGFATFVIVVSHCTRQVVGRQATGPPSHESFHVVSPFHSFFDCACNGFPTTAIAPQTFSLKSLSRRIGQSQRQRPLLSLRW